MRTRAAWILCAALGACGEEKRQEPAPVPAATVSNPAKEAELATIVLAPAAETRLGIRVAAVEVRKVERTRMRGGVASALPGARVTVAAPLAGTLSAEAPPRAGERVARGRAVFSLAPILTPDARASLAASRARAEGEARRAAAELEAARVALARAEQLLKDKAGPQKAEDEGKARVEGAQAALRAAEAEREVLAAAEGGTALALPLAAPFDGVLLGVHAAPGQAVPAGAPLFEAADTARLWVRVPIFAGDAGAIDRSKDALVNGRPARPTDGPPSADPAGATVDFYYEVDNREGGLRPGENVAVTLALASGAESKVVPHGAVVHDAHGGAWVYERTKPLTYVRRRVQVAHVTEGLAVLADGPPAGREVVSVAALELFGTEFFVSK